MAIATTPDIAAIQTFAEKTFGDLAATMSIMLAAAGDRLGLYKALAERGALTSQELADAANVDERYAREWLNGSASSGYLAYDALTGTYSLPAAHAPVLAGEGGPAFIGGRLEQLPSALATFDLLMDAFRTGEGVPQSAFDHHFWTGLERDAVATIDNALLQEWIPAIPDLRPRLERGATVADIGCGAARSLIRMAEAFPNSRFTGYDNFPAQVELARTGVDEAGLSDRVTIELHDVAQGLTRQFDVVTSFDVIHDAADPAALMTRIRESLNPNGIYMMVEPGAGETVEDNLGPLGTILYSFGLFYCMPVSLAEDGAGLGMAGLPESKVRELAASAGFRDVRNAGIQHPLNAMYELRA